MSISCFLEDINLIFKTFEMLLDGSSSFFGPRLFAKCETFGDSEIYNNQIFENWLDIFLDFRLVSWCLQR